MKTDSKMKAIATTLSVIAETGFGVLLNPSFIEMLLVMGAAQAAVILYALIASSAKARRFLRRVFCFRKPEKEGGENE